MIMTKREINFRPYTSENHRGLWPTETICGGRFHIQLQVMWDPGLNTIKRPTTIKLSVGKSNSVDPFLLETEAQIGVSTYKCKRAANVRIDMEKMLSLSYFCLIAYISA